MGQIYLLVLALALGIASAGHRNNQWSYHLDSKTSPEKWAELYPDRCGPSNKFQSPIDISSAASIFSEDLDTIDFIDKSESESQAEGKAEPEGKSEEAEAEENENGEKDEHNGHSGHDMGGAQRDEGHKDGMEEKSEEKNGRKMSLFNNGHSAQVNVEEGDQFFMSSALGTQYKVAQIHFHWGKNGSVGSEHRINGEMYHLEMHVVTYDHEKYSALGEAVGTKDGLAVFAVLFKLGKHNTKLNNVVNNLEHVIKPGGHDHKVAIDWFDIGAALPASLQRYYRYEGSLTTPTCDGTVRWTVFEEHPSVCPSQLKKFYNLREGRREDGEPVQLENNWRPPQPLNGREVLSSFIHGEKAVKYNVVQGQDGNTAPNLRLPSLLLIVSSFLLYVAKNVM